MTEGQRSCAYEGCDRVPHETSSDGHCIFHTKAEEKEIPPFYAALESYMKDIESKGLDYDFKNFVFVGIIDFGAYYERQLLVDGHLIHRRFSRLRLAWDAKLHRDALFMGAEFYEEVSFWGVEFRKKAYFTQTKFRESVDFGEAEFQEGADFGGTEFRGRTEISPKLTKGTISFADTKLENISLASLNLDENARIYLTGAQLKNTEIRRKNIEKRVIEELDKNFYLAKETYLLLKNNFHSLGRYDDESWAFMQEKEMERRSFFHYRKEYKEQELGEKLKNRSIKDSLYCLFLAYVHSGVYADERMAEWFQSDGISVHIRRLDRLFPIVINLLRHPIEGIKSRLKSYCSFLELNRRKRMGKVSPRDLFKVFWFYTKYPIKYAWSTFLKWLYGWGEKPWRIFIWCGITIFIFSVLYCFIGGITTATNAPMRKPYLERLYFSGITFTTLGFGGYSPMGWAKVLAFIESFLGIFSIALFVYSFARRTAGR